MSRPIEYTCCVDDSPFVQAPCGRWFRVCTTCDNGINACTEGECEHVVTGR